MCSVYRIGQVYIENTNMHEADLIMVVLCLQVEMVSDPPGKYPHLGGGLTAIIDSSQPAGQRILVLQYNCGNISATDTLHLATNNFVAGTTSCNSLCLCLTVSLRHSVRSLLHKIRLFLPSSIAWRCFSIARSCFYDMEL